MRSALLLLLFATPAVLAQPTVDFGARVGGSLSALTVDYPEFDGQIDTDRRAGYEAALLADVVFGNTFGVTSEVGYAHRRYARSAEETVRANDDVGFISLGTGKVVTSFDVASFGVLGKITPLGRAKWTPFVTAGPRLDVLLGSTPGSSEAGTPTSTLMIEDPFPGIFRDVSLSGVAGVGVDVRQMRWPVLRIEARYGRTLTGFFDAENVEGALGSFDLSVGVTF